MDKQIEEYKSRRGRAFFYKKPKNKLETLGEKRIMRFDTRYREFQVDGATGKRRQDVLNQRSEYAWKQ